MRPGDMLLLYTDGVTEAQNTDGGFFEESRLETILQENRGKSGHTMIALLLEKIKLFAGKAQQTDDITILTAKLLEKTAEEPE